MGRRPLTVSSLAARWGHAFAGPVRTLYQAAEMIPGDGGSRSAKLSAPREAHSQAPDRLCAARRTKRSIPHPILSRFARGPPSKYDPALSGPLAAIAMRVLSHY